LLESHKEFWEKRIGTQNLKNSLKRKINAGNDSGQESIQKIPDLELYIINVFSPMGNRGSTANNCRLEDIDEIRDRKMDITLSDGYDAKTDELFTDYLNLIERLISLGENDEVISERINKILEEYALRRFSTEEVRTNFDILISKFKIVKVVQVQRRDDPDSISRKLGDFTSETLNKWIQEGYQDAIKQ
jgi:NTE family protein